MYIFRFAGAKLLIKGEKSKINEGKLVYFENYVYFCNPIRGIITTKKINNNEKNISAAQSPPREQAWFPRAYGNKEWSPCIGFSPCKRS